MSKVVLCVCWSRSPANSTNNEKVGAYKSGEPKRVLRIEFQPSPSEDHLRGTHLLELVQRVLWQQVLSRFQGCCSMSCWSLFAIEIIASTPPSTPSSLTPFPSLPPPSPNPKPRRVCSVKVLFWGSKGLVTVHWVHGNSFCQFERSILPTAFGSYHVSHGRPLPYTGREATPKSVENCKRAPACVFTWSPPFLRHLLVFSTIHTREQCGLYQYVFE